ncbi:hypothetical protein B9Z65_5967 [Elsinoe australis]|uniref:Uncharacterized protein n=1 Tax=Elsinoe australis TaxID=40998 RepID=A0A2P7YJL0_9PEZI|nr:hypothetical protein B9Z65_5967 [Elsinoe australis]
MTSISPLAASTAKPYSYARASATATRSLVDSNPPSTHQSGTATPSDPISPHGTLHRRKTNNYETALADRLKETVASDSSVSPEESHKAAATSSSDATKPVVVAGLAYRGDAAAAQVGQGVGEKGPTGPVVTEGSERLLLGVLGRQQSFKQGDQKRMVMERMLSSEAVEKRGGYTTSQPTTPA